MADCILSTKSTQPKSPSAAKSPKPLKFNKALKSTYKTALVCHTCLRRILGTAHRLSCKHLVCVTCSDSFPPGYPRLCDDCYSSRFKGDFGCDECPHCFITFTETNPKETHRCVGFVRPRTEDDYIMVPAPTYHPDWLGLEEHRWLAGGSKQTALLRATTKGLSQGHTSYQKSCLCYPFKPFKLTPLF